MNEEDTNEFLAERNLVAGVKLPTEAGDGSSEISTHHWGIYSIGAVCLLITPSEVSRAGGDLLITCCDLALFAVDGLVSTIGNDGL